MLENDMNKIEFGDPELTRQFGRLRRKYNKYFRTNAALPTGNIGPLS
jgi:hypothetical protein